MNFEFLNLSEALGLSSQEHVEPFQPMDGGAILNPPNNYSGAELNMDVIRSFQ